jgi:hypothetical protein
VDCPCLAMMAQVAVGVPQPGHERDKPTVLANFNVMAASVLYPKDVFLVGIVCV